MNKALLLTLPLALTLAACATNTKRGEFVGDDIQDREDVLMTPVNDLGLNDIEIPLYLSQMSNPYKGRPADCASLTAEVSQLNQLLGSDLDVSEDDDAKNTQLQLNAASSAVGSVLIPFRGVVRAVTGASKNEREARNAYERGLVRRAYLKGRGEELGCTFVPL